MKASISPIDVFLSHDWPAGITKYGDERALLKKKPFFRADIESGKLGSPPLMHLLQWLQPTYWFAAHLHCKFTAIVTHGTDPSASSTTAATTITTTGADGDDSLATKKRLLLETFQYDTVNTDVHVTSTTVAYSEQAPPSAQDSNAIDLADDEDDIGDDTDMGDANNTADSVHTQLVDNASFIATTSSTASYTPTDSFPSRPPPPPPTPPPPPPTDNSSIGSGRAKTTHFAAFDKVMPGRYESQYYS